MYVATSSMSNRVELIVTGWLSSWKFVVEPSCSIEVDKVVVRVTLFFWIDDWVVGWE